MLYSTNDSVQQNELKINDKIITFLHFFCCLLFMPQPQRSCQSNINSYVEKKNIYKKIKCIILNYLNIFMEKWKLMNKCSTPSEAIFIVTNL